jgi:hypothetical protein
MYARFFSCSFSVSGIVINVIHESVAACMFFIQGRHQVVQVQQVRVQKFKKNL